MNKNINEALKHRRLINTDLIDSLRRLNEASNSSSTIEQMLNKSLSVILDIFQCDRAWMLRPCDPKATSFDVKAEKTVPQWPGAWEANIPVEIAIGHEVSLEQFLSAPGPTIIDVRETTFLRDLMEAWSVKTQLTVVIETRMDRPWLLGLHYCSQHHDFSGDEVVIFDELANRLAEALNSMQAVQNARRSEERFRTLIEHAPEAILVFDTERNQITDVNMNAEILFGCSREQLIGKGFEPLIPKVLPDGKYASDVLAVNIAHAVAGEAAVFEFLFNNASKNSIDCEVRLVRLPSDEGVLLRGSITDISERKCNESRMHKLSSALQQTADAVLITDSDGIIEYVNAAFESLTGYDYKEVVGQRPDFLGSGSHDSNFYQELWATIKAGKVFNDVLINRRKDGVLFYEEKTITPLKNSVGEITHFISTGRDITDRIEVQERLRYMAHHDELTQLPNRSMMMDHLGKAIARAKRDGSRVAVLFIDLDHFKMINDTLGHDVGDRALKEVARLLRISLRASDTVVRFGGDEFVILLEDIRQQDEVTCLVRKVLATLSEPIHMQGEELFMSSSIGVTLYPDDGDDVNTLLKHADIAMYRAKDSGRNRYEFYSSEMGARAYERLTIETKVRNAVKHEAFELFYQPQIDIKSGKPIGVEALLRWFPEAIRESMGEILPEQFVPILEETGLIVEVGEWALNTACDQLKQLQALAEMPLRMSVNLSSRQFRDARLDRKIEQVIADHGLDPTNIELEITETLLMERHQLIHDMLNRINEMGIRLSLDDFGTGYSSLSYLKRFPINTLKIDRSFVRDICDDPDDRAIVTAIIVMARSLKLNIVAEGVESEAQLLFLQEQQCDIAQGFYYSEALRGDAIGPFLASRLEVPHC